MDWWVDGLVDVGWMDWWMGGHGGIWPWGTCLYCGRMSGPRFMNWKENGWRRWKPWTNVTTSRIQGNALKPTLLFYEASEAFSLHIDFFLRQPWGRKVKTHFHHNLQLCTAPNIFFKCETKFRFIYLQQDLFKGVRDQWKSNPIFPKFWEGSMRKSSARANRQTIFSCWPQEACLQNNRPRTSQLLNTVQFQL